MDVRFSRNIGAWILALVLGSALSGALVTGDAAEVASDIRHPNGNIYDQVSLRGVSATIRADPGEITRISFIDLNDDIVQVELSGAGSLTITLDFPSGPAPAAKYNQPGIEYMRGHASIAIVGSDATTNVTVFSVGRCTALNPALFPEGATYDGVADIARIAILVDPANPGFATFGSIFAGNAHFFARESKTGIEALNVNVQGVVRIGDLSAFDDATPVLKFGAGSRFVTLLVAGGDLEQPNGRAIQVGGFEHFSLVAGATSGCGELFAQPNRGTFDWGVGLTDEKRTPPVR